VERGASPRTLLAYEGDLKKLLAFAEGRKAAVLELKQGDIAEFIGSLRDQGLQARSQARAVFALRGFFRFALREGLRDSDPMENLRAP